LGVTKLGDVLFLPLNSERLQKLTEDYVVSNVKVVAAFRKELPVTFREVLVRTFEMLENINKN
jgi:hypothetical protein